MGGNRSIAIGIGALVALAALLAILLLLRPAGALAVAQAAPGARFEGVASCGGTTCHGRSEANRPAEGPVRQDELMLWQDPSSAAGAHSRAYAVLRSDRSRRIIARLRQWRPSAWSRPAWEEPDCLGCHATPAPPSQRGPRFRLTDGVGCEACHGAASGWLQSHRAVGATHAANLRRGLTELDHPRVRAETCLDCHFGSERDGQFVTHEIMAGGHPRISFELDLFTTLQQHHDEDADYYLPEPRGRAKRRNEPLRSWAIGQAMALDRSLALFETDRRGMAGLFPEFYFFDCHSCHRRIYDQPGRGPDAAHNPGRPIPAGMVPYNDENLIMLAAAARIAAPQLAERLERESRAFHEAMTRGRSAAVAAARPLRRTAQELARAFETRPMGPQQTFAIVREITGEAIGPRFTDYAGSVQAVMATDTLLTALVSQGRVSEAQANAIRVDINGAYRAVRDPNEYDPAAFRASLRRAATAIGRLGR